MLSSLFLFSLKSSVVLCVLYLAYHFLFRKNTHFHTRRIILLVIIGASLSLPMLQYETSSKLAPESPAIRQFDKLAQPEGENGLKFKTQTTVASGPVKNEASVPKTKSSFNWLKTASLGYLGGVIIMFALFLLEVIRLGWILGRGKARHDLNRMAVTHKLIKFPFSFWRWIFLPQDLIYDKETWEMIQEHENVHLNQGHTLDVLFSTILRCLLWFNPAVYFLHKNIKDNHEALADRTILEEHDLSKYSQALLEVCLQTGTLNLGHAFALKSNLSKRINTMNLSKTSLGKSVLSLLLFCAISVGLFTQTSLYGQQREMKKEDKEMIQKAIDSGVMTFAFMARNKLAERHQRVLEKLQRLNPDVKLKWEYQKDNTILEYLQEYRPNQETLYFDKISKEDKESIYNQAIADTTRGFFGIKGLEIDKRVVADKIQASITDDYNYLLIYELKADPWAEENQVVYEMNQVDILPEPIGGIDNFVRAIALDSELPDGISQSDLPATVDFEFVVKGGRGVTSMNLVTELKGNRKKQDKIYKFFGVLHNSIRSKVRTVYSWKKGMKDGKEVNVRMIVSIPTKYM
ncbi:MAG: M56 family metallopeptidase [Roseivirga sp.]|nr:M56 family metallopeptidase [Roseivirga sp.]